MASSMAQKHIEMFCKQVFGRLIGTVGDFGSNRPECTTALYEEVIRHCQRLIPYYRGLMSDFTLEESTSEYNHYIQDLLDGIDLNLAQPSDMASVDALCSSSINPAILDLSRGINKDLELVDTSHAVDESDSSFSDNSSVDDEDAGLEAESTSSENENTESTIHEQRLTVRAQSRVRVQKKAKAREKTSARLHKRRRSTATKNIVTRKSVHVETFGRLIKVAATAEAFQQLSATFQLIRKEVTMRLPPETESLANTINYMKSLEGFAPGEKLLKRYYNCQIYRRRQELQKSYSKEVTLDRMLQEAYPGRPLPNDRNADKKRRDLKNQLFAARNWILMQETLGEASIALIPSQGKAQIWNQRVANMPEAIFRTFLQRLKTKCGSLIESMCSKLGPHLMPILRGVDRTTHFKFEELSEDELDGWLHDASRIEGLFSLTEYHKD